MLRLTFRSKPRYYTSVQLFGIWSHCSNKRCDSPRSPATGSWQSVAEAGWSPTEDTWPPGPRRFRLRQPAAPARWKLKPRPSWPAHSRCQPSEYRRLWDLGECLPVRYWHLRNLWPQMSVPESWVTLCLWRSRSQSQVVLGQWLGRLSGQSESMSCHQKCWSPRRSRLVWSSSNLAEQTEKSRWPPRSPQALALSLSIG